MTEILIRGMPELSEEELVNLNQRFLAFTIRQFADGLRYKSVNAVLEDFFTKSFADMKICISDKTRHESSPHLVFEPTNGSFAQWTPKKSDPHESERQNDAVEQEDSATLHLPGANRSR